VPFTALVFGFTQRQMTAWLRYGGGMELANEFYRDYSVKAFSAGDPYAQVGLFESVTVRPFRHVYFKAPA
jgi:TRAP-type mannitol/chloroaromatic compound transport system substrate-binding protein